MPLVLLGGAATRRAQEPHPGDPAVALAAIRAPATPAPVAPVWPAADFRESLEFEVLGAERAKGLPAGVEVPVRIPLDAVMDRLDIGRGLVLHRVDPDGVRVVPLQAEMPTAAHPGPSGGAEGPRLVFLHEPSAGATHYVLRNAGTAGASVGDPVELADPDETFAWAEGEDGVLRAEFGGRTLLGYCFGTQLAAGIAETFARSCYVHPWVGPTGENLLDDFPEDHYHHRGISWMWPRVIVEGETYDLWTLRGVEQRFESFGERIAGSVFASVEVTNGWYVGDRRILEERVRLTVYRPCREGPQRGASVLDVELEFESTDRTVELAGQTEEDKGYGGFGFRMAPGEEVEIVSSRGLEAQDCLHDEFSWVSYSAKLRGATVRTGVADFSHSDNPDAPNAWMLRHYGYCGESWPGLDPRPLVPGAPLRLRHRLTSFQGSAAGSEDLAREYEIYVHPLEVRLLDP